MTSLRALVPEATAVVGMLASDLAGYILEVLMSAGPMERGIWNRRNFCMQTSRDYALPGQGGDESVGVACSSAWAWLEANSFIARHPEQDNEWFVPTRRGEALRNHQELEQFMTSERLPESFLQPELLQNVRPLFFQARFETAVFEAFKTLEVAIRSAAGLGHDLFGIQLASRAFNPEDGPLTDMDAEKGERVALMNLMTGALGSYKNPTSHRRVEIEAHEARDMIVLASHLLGIVESRRRM
jgi:uncharacterized protein (TIGR02391 family)